MCVVCGWCRSFTNTERALLAVQAVLLVLAGALLLLLVLHLVACRDRLVAAAPLHTATANTTTAGPTAGTVTDDASPTAATGRSSPDTTTTVTTDIECTWEPSVQTKAGERHFLRPEKESLSGRLSWALSGGLLLVEGADGAVCAGVAVSPAWTVTGRTCGKQAERAGGRRVVEGRVHPSVPLVLLRTGPAPRGRQYAALPSALQAALLGPGERLTVFGYHFRDRLSRYEVRSESVRSLPRRACSSAGARAARHILPLGALSGAGCPRAPLCAGAASWADRGTVLLRGQQLLAIQTDTSAAGTATYTGLAAVRDWILHVIST